jgi:hypothetical protein
MVAHLKSPAESKFLKAAKVAGSLHEKPGLRATKIGRYQHLSARHRILRAPKLSNRLDDIA